MTRVKRGVTTKRRHKKIIALAKGFRGGRSKIFKLAKNAVAKAGMHAYVDRRKKKRDFRALWILRLTAAVRARGMNYSSFIGNMRKKHVILNRKTMSEVAIHNPEVFDKVVEAVK